MKRILRNTILGAAVAATALSAMPAQANDWRGRQPHRPQVVQQHDNRGDLVAAGILGLAAGVIVAGIVAGANNRQPVAQHNPYRQPRPTQVRDYFPDAPRGVHDDRRGHGYAAEPWSRDWYRYCTARYRTFDPATGTYIARGGQERFCVAG